MSFHTRKPYPARPDAKPSLTFGAVKISLFAPPSSSSSIKEGFSANVVTFFRSQNDIYLDLMWNGLDDIERRTGCQKPCIFKKYSFPGDRQVCKYPSCLRYQMCTTGDLNEIKYSLYLPIFIFGQIGCFANISNILIKYAGDLTEIGPLRFLFGRCFKLHKCRDGTPHLSSFLIGIKNNLSYLS